MEENKVMETVEEVVSTEVADAVVPDDTTITQVPVVTDDDTIGIGKVMIVGGLVVLGGYLAIKLGKKVFNAAKEANKYSRKEYAKLRGENDLFEDEEIDESQTDIPEDSDEDVEG